jgi:cytochrome b561
MGIEAAKHVAAPRPARPKDTISVTSSVHRIAGHERSSDMTRILHLLLLLAVLHQLISSQFIERPIPGDAPSLLFSLHEYIGLATFLIVFLFWIWTLIRNGESKLGKLLPWFSRARLRSLAQEILGQLRQLRCGDFSDKSSGAVASAVHGLGLLVVTAMALTGAIYFFAKGSAYARTALDVHSLMANLMWAYLIGHTSLAALHHLLGSDILARMFWLRRRWPSSLPLPWRTTRPGNIDAA